MSQTEPNRVEEGADIQPALFTPPSEAKPPVASQEFPGEKAATAELLAEFRRVLKPLQPMTEISPGSLESLDQLEKALLHLPSGPELGAEIDRLYQRTRALIAKCRQERGRAFGALEASFIQELRTSGESPREVGGRMWRVGALGIHFDEAQPRARALYNREVVVTWQQIASLRDLHNLRKRGLQELKSCEIPAEKLLQAFETAYDSLASKNAGQNTRVPVQQLYPETRLALARMELAKKPDATISLPRFPVWAFLYNLDRYVKNAAMERRTGRLILVTGSQLETDRLGMRVNGLDPAQDYTTVCFVQRA